MKSNTWILLAIGVGLLLALPALLSQSLVNAAIQMLIAALFACSFNLLCGQAGMLSFGHAAYFRSEEHTSELQSLMRISYAVFCLKNKKKRRTTHNRYTNRTN